VRNLYLRIFVSFWIAMVLVLTFTVLATLWLADQRAQREQSRQDQLAHEASSVLAARGIPGLRDWLTHESALVAPSCGSAGGFARCALAVAADLIER
jgi:hypothetical protein